MKKTIKVKAQYLIDHVSIIEASEIRPIMGMINNCLYISYIEIELPNGDTISYEFHWDEPTNKLYCNNEIVESTWTDQSTHASIVDYIQPEISKLIGRSLC